MAEKIALEQDAKDIGKGAQLVTSNKCCTMERAKAFGCKEISGYDSNRLVPKSLLEAAVEKVTLLCYITWNLNKGANPYKGKSYDLKAKQNTTVLKTWTGTTGTLWFQDEVTHIEKWSLSGFITYEKKPGILIMLKCEGTLGSDSINEIINASTGEIKLNDNII